MKRKKRDCYVIVIFVCALFECCDTLVHDDLYLSESIRSTAVDQSNLIDDEVLQQLSHHPIKSTSGLRYELPTGNYPEDLPRYRYDGGYGYTDSKLLLPHNDRADVEFQEPFEIEVDDRINPYELVNIDRTEETLRTGNLETTSPTTTAAPAAVAATNAPKRAGEMEYATFVNPPSMRKKEEKSVLNAPPVAEASKQMSGSKKVTGSDIGDTVFYAVAGVCSLAAVLGLVFASISYTRLRNQYKQSQLNEYPSFGFGGLKKSRSPDSVVAMDSKLASAAQLYHFQHTKQQIISMEHPSCDVKEAVSEDSELEEDEGDYSVYECPGLAPTGNMEINNPIFLKTKNGNNGTPKVNSGHVVEKGSKSAEIQTQ